MLRYSWADGTCQGSGFSPVKIRPKFILPSPFAGLAAGLRRRAGTVNLRQSVRVTTCLVRRFLPLLRQRERVGVMACMVVRIPYAPSPCPSPFGRGNLTFTVRAESFD